MQLLDGSLQRLRREYCQIRNDEDWSFEPQNPSVLRLCLRLPVLLINTTSPFTTLSFSAKPFRALGRSHSRSLDGEGLLTGSCPRYFLGRFVPKGVAAAAAKGSPWRCR